MADELTDTSLRSTMTRLPAEARRILLVESDQQVASAVARQLEEAWPQIQIVRATDIAQVGSALDAQVECVLLGLLRAEDTAGVVESVRGIRAAESELPIVVLVESDEQGGAAIGEGAQDFLLRERLNGPAIARVIRHSIQRGRAERLSRELALLRFQSAETARIQRGLIPRLMIDDPRISTRSGYRPGNRRQVLGGDFFDVIQTSPTLLHVALGDVCGHGPDEAALGVQLRIAWRTLILAGVDHQELLVTLDRLAAQERHAEHVYATIASIEIDLAVGTGEVALAGHPPPIVERGGKVGLITEHSGGPPLGIDLPPRWTWESVDLGQHWKLLLYSDGIYEGQVASRGTRLGIDGLLDVISNEGPGALWNSVPDRLLDQVEALNDGPLEDDVALLAMRFDS